MKIVIALLLINLRALVYTSHETINQKISFWSCIFTTWVSWCTFLQYVWHLIFALPNITQCMCICHFCQKILLTSSESKECYQQNLSTDKKLVNEENLLSPCRITFRFLSEPLKYAQGHFAHELQNKNRTLVYLRTWCFAKNVTFNATKAFQSLAKSRGVRQRLSWFFPHPSALVILRHKKYIISMVPSLLKW